MAVRLRAVLAAAAIVLAPSAATAQAHTFNPPPHVRGATPETAVMLRDLMGRSPTARALVDRLDQSDVIVYVRQRWFSMVTLRGRIGFLASDTQRRFLLIELSSHHNHTEQLAALGHELQHAVEIAMEPDVRDVGALSALYTRIGDSTGTNGGLETYETRAAQDAGLHVRHELAQPVTSADLVDADRH